MATLDGPSPKGIGLALAITGVVLVLYRGGGGDGGGGGGGGSALRSGNEAAPRTIPLRVLTLGLSTRARACDAPAPSGAELLLAEECGRVHADVTLGLRLYAEAAGPGAVVVKACGDADNGACDHLTLWGRVVANTTTTGERTTIAGVDPVPIEGRRCEWRVALPLIREKAAVRYFVSFSCWVRDRCAASANSSLARSSRQRLRHPHRFVCSRSPPAGQVPVHSRGAIGLACSGNGCFRNIR